MVSESELVYRVREILETADLNTTTAGAIRRQLEAEFGVDLSERKKFISQQIDEILEANANGAVEQPEEENDAEKQEEDDSDDNESSKSEEPIKKKRGTGFTRLCSLSPQLQDFVGVSEMARTEVVKKLWAYIRENHLQDPSNRRNIKCDHKLRTIFRVDTINMFQMNKALSKHIWPLETDQDSSVSSAPAEKKQKRQREEDVEKPQQKPKQQKGGFLAPLQMSEAFVRFLGSGETTLSRADAVKRIWKYIKENNLQDPSDKRRILCDEKLKELFEVDTFNGFSVTKFLSAHLSKLGQ